MGRSFDPRWDRTSADEFRARQGRLLREFVTRYLYPFSPYYRRLFREAGIDPRSIRSLDDLARIPMTSKEDIAPTANDPQRPKSFVLQPTADLIREHWPLSRKLPMAYRSWTAAGKASVRRRLAQEFRPISVFFTTGRSALPTAFLLTTADIEILKEAGRRVAEVGAMDPDVDKVLNLFPYAPHLAFWQVYYVGVGAHTFTLNTGGGKVMGTDGILQSLVKLEPAYIAGIPGYVYHILREAQSKQINLSFVKGLALGGDRVTPGYRTRVKEILVSLGATAPRVGSVYGFTEARKCWSECRGEDAAGFHTYPDLEVVEAVDPETGKAVGDGESGELVYTCLSGRGSCVLRYRTGDLLMGGITWKPCGHCGRTVPRMSSQLERVSNLKSFQLSKVRGTLVNLNVFKEELDNDQRVEEWQLVIKKRDDDPFEVDELHLNLALARGVSESQRESVRHDIERKLLQATEVKVNAIHLLPLQTLLDLLGMDTQLKERRIVDLRGDHAAARNVSSGKDSSRAVS